MADRARREKKAKLDKLAEYKRARDGGGRSWKVSTIILGILWRLIRPT
jgi:hypothetical protein